MFNKTKYHFYLHSDYLGLPTTCGNQHHLFMVKCCMPVLMCWQQWGCKGCCCEKRPQGLPWVKHSWSQLCSGPTVGHSSARESSLQHLGETYLRKSKQHCGAQNTVRRVVEGREGGGGGNNRARVVEAALRWSRYCSPPKTYTRG